MSKGGKLPRNVADSHVHQINVLKVMSSGATLEAGHVKEFQLNDISSRCGIKDEKETQRYLYILEGQKLVTPLPEGDFTSRTWRLTGNGVKAVRMIQKETTQ
jgi:hypothetical protein